MKPEAYDIKLELTAMDTIEKYIADGLSEKDAVDKWERRVYTRLPDQIRDLIKERKW